MPAAFLFLRFGRFAAIVFSLFATALATTVPCNGQSSPLDPVRDRYERSAGLEARFEQISDDPAAESRISGTLYLQGERYRLETSTRTVVTDGTTVWVHEKGANRVLVSDLVEDETTFSIPDFLYRFDDRWRVASSSAQTQGGEPVDIVTLSAIDPDDWFTRVVTTVRRRDASLTRIEVTDVSGATMTFALRDIVERPLGAGFFRFEAPAGSEIVDLRS